MRILVTGGAGYIGSITAMHLLAAGHRVVVLDTLERGFREAVPDDATFVQGDVGSADAVREAVDGCDAVVHCAGYIEVAESMTAPARYFADNTAAPLVLLEVMAECGIDALVFSSSAAVYGSPGRIPVVEGDPTLPVSPYGESKLMFERVLSWQGRATGLRSVSLRYFNAAGAWLDGLTGEAHEPETHLVPRILRSVAAGEHAVELFGDDYPTPDGTCVRDYVHVLDLADAHLLAARYLVEGRPSVTLNLGSGTGYSNREVVTVCREATGERLEVRIGPRREGDPAVLVASNDLARDVLGWVPRHSDLPTIVGSAWAWHSAHPTGY
jgi:UDP-glucose 4-epimerase